jgi:choline-sulfatase
MYPTEEIDMPPSFMPEYPWKDDIGCSAKLRDEKLAPFPRTEHAVKVNRREYYAIITHMDAQIGRILDHLEKTGQADNTYIFFTADHGLSVGHHGLIGKQSLFDHSVRVPFMAAGPGIKAGAKNDSPIYLQSAMATSLALAGAERPEHVQFDSLLPMLKEDKPGGLDAVYLAYVNVQRAITADGHKLLLFPKIKKAQLFHMTDDPEEMSDLSEKPGSKDIMKKLFAELQELQKESGDKLDLKPLYPELL